jgi:hypothetical protein
VGPVRELRGKGPKLLFDRPYRSLGEAICRWPVWHCMAQLDTVTAAELFDLLGLEGPCIVSNEQSWIACFLKVDQQGMGDRGGCSSHDQIGIKEARGHVDNNQEEAIAHC